MAHCGDYTQRMRVETWLAAAAMSRPANQQVTSEQCSPVTSAQTQCLAAHLLVRLQCRRFVINFSRPSHSSKRESDVHAAAAAAAAAAADPAQYLGSYQRSQVVLSFVVRAHCQLIHGLRR